MEVQETAYLKGREAVADQRKANKKDGFSKIHESFKEALLMALVVDHDVAAPSLSKFLQDTIDLASPSKSRNYWNQCLWVDGAKCDTPLIMAASMVSGNLLWPDRGTPSGYTMFYL